MKEMDLIETYEEEEDFRADDLLTKYNTLLEDCVFGNKWRLDLRGDGKKIYIIDDVNWFVRLLYRIFLGSKFTKI